MSTSPSIKNLTRDFIEKRWRALAAIDLPYVERGLLEDWSRRQFLYEIEGKWTLSQIALLGNRVIGYRVVSGRGKEEGCAHSHRTAVEMAYTRRGYARALLNRAASAAKRRGYTGMTGLCHPNNEISRAFLEKTGWEFTGRFINGNQLWYLRL